MISIRKLLVYFGVFQIFINVIAPFHHNINKLTLSVAIPSFYELIWNSQLLADFELQHPDVQVKLVVSNTVVSPPQNNDPNRLAEYKQYAESADVLFVGNTGLNNPIASDMVRSGLFLNLKPYVDADPTFVETDLPPSVSRAFRWDNGLWAIPSNVDPILLNYDPTAFDSLGLLYPNATWTLGDFADTVKKLTQQDATGKVVTPGLASVQNMVSALLVSTSGQRPYDDSISPNQPVVARPEFVQELTRWTELKTKGHIGYAINSAPLALADWFMLLPRNDPPQHRIGTLLPGGKSALLTNGFAVSSGTANPELAYTLAQFLVARSTFAVDAYHLYGHLPAHKRQFDQIRGELSPRLLNVVMQAIDAGLSDTDLRYGEYIDLALSKMSNGGLDAETALQQAQNQAINDLKAADAAKATLIFSVNEPPDPAPLPAGKIALSFGLPNDILAANPEAWKQLAQNFVAQDSLVGRIDVRGSQFSFLNFVTKHDDCFFSEANQIPNANLSLLRTLDPFMETDKGFDPTAIMAGALKQLQRQGHTWALPITIQPAILRYNVNAFDSTSITLVQNQWSIDEFVNLLKTLKMAGSTEAPLGLLHVGDGESLLMLITAFGGLPIDYRVDPPRIDFTSRENTDAIQQVLDLVKQGYIGYRVFGTLNPPIENDPAILPAFYPDQIGVQNFGQAEFSRFERPVGYPHGQRYIPVSFDVGAGYISADAANPEACYRWLTLISQHPAMFGSMPALRSMLSDTSFALSQGSETTDFYRQFDKLARSSSAIIFPYNGQSATSPWLEHWLYKAFDDYVLHNKPLEASLKDADDLTKAFEDCVAAQPPFDPTMSTTSDYSVCAKKIDPSL